MATQISPTKQVKNQIDFHSLRENMKECRQWFIKKGFRFEPSRFNNGLKILENYEKRSEPLNKNELWLVSELMDLNEAYQLLNDSLTNEVKDNFKKSMGGTLLLSEEKNTEARNYFFELKVASRFKKSGCEVVLPKEKLTDIALQLDGFIYKIECKRVQSQNSVKKRIEEASAQLTRKLSKGETGIIALDFSKLLYELFTDQDFLLAYENDAKDIRKIFDETIPSVCEEILNQISDNRVGIILGHIRFPVFTPENSILTINHFFTLKNSNQINSSHAIATLREALKKSTGKKA